MPTLYVVNVRHGNSAVLVDTNGIIVFDAGPSSHLKEFLLNKSITVIDILMLSHADADHIGGAMALITSQKFTIKSVYINSDSIKTSAIFRDLIYSLYSDPKIKLEPSITPNLNGKLNQGNVEVEILAPNTFLATMAAGGRDRKLREIKVNSISSVIRLNYKNKKIALLPGDIDSVGLDNLLDDHAEINAWLLVFPHHGGNPGSENNIDFVERFCEITKAEFVIFSINNNDNKFPKIEVIECIANTLKTATMFTTGSSKIFLEYIKKHPYCSHKNGVGNIEIDFDTLSITTENNGK